MRNCQFIIKSALNIIGNPYSNKFLNVITGTYDALILARFKTEADLSKMIKEIHTSPYVERTNTHLVLNTIKEASSFTTLTEEENKRKK